MRFNHSVSSSSLFYIVIPFYTALIAVLAFFPYSLLGVLLSPCCSAPYEPLQPLLDKIKPPTPTPLSAPNPRIPSFAKPRSHGASPPNPHATHSHPVGSHSSSNETLPFMKKQANTHTHTQNTLTITHQQHHLTFIGTNLETSPIH